MTHQIRISLRRGLAPGLAAALALVAGCGESTGPGSGMALDAYVQGLGNWAAFAPEAPPQDTPTGPATTTQETVQEVVNGILTDVTYACTETPYSITDTPTEIVMYEPNASIMWVGNLIQGRSYRDGVGSFQELSIRQRAPLRVGIDLLSGDNFAVVDNPSLTSVQSAIGGLIQRATEAGHRSGSSIDFNSHLTHSVEQAALKLGLSARYLGVRAKADLSVQRQASERTLTAHFVQKMFTISVELPQSPSDFFSDALTQAVLDQQIQAGNLGPDNLPVYLVSITYGRTLTYSLTTSFSEDRMRAAIAASFNGLVGGAGGYSEAELRETLSQEHVRVTAIGGEGQNVLDLIAGGNLKAYFTSDAALTSARPISYQLNYLGDNTLAKVSETTAYTLRACEALPSSDVVSDFENDDEGWTVEDGVLGRQGREPIDGDWYIQATDNNSQTAMFRAPAKFRGDKADYYGGNLSFFVRWSMSGSNKGTPFAWDDVLIEGANGNTLAYRFGRDNWSEDVWELRQAAITEAAGWTINGQPGATEQQIRDVLADVLQVRIRGEYRVIGGDVAYLDRVILSKSPLP